MRVPIRPLLALTALAAVPAAQTVGSTVNIANPVNDTFNPLVVSNGAGTALVSTFVADSRVQSSRSTNNGVSWSSPIFVDDDVSALGTFKTGGTQGDRPSLYASGDNIYQIWETNRNGANDLYFARSTDGGVTWDADIRLDDSGPIGMSHSIRDWCAFVSPGSPDDSIYVLLTVDPGMSGAFLDEELYLVASQDSGATFGSAVSASTENGNADVDVLTMVADGLDVHIAWVDDRAGGGLNDVFYRRSTDGGISWDFDEIQIDSSGPNFGSAFFPTMDVQGSKIALGFSEQLGGTTDQNRVAVSLDGGDTWSADVMVGNYTANLDDVDFFTLRWAPGGTLVAVWDDDRLDIPKTGLGALDAVFANYSTDNGATWQSTDAQLGVTPSNFPAIAVGSCEMAAIWNGGGVFGMTEKTQAAATVDGQLWSASFDVSANTGDVDFSIGSYDAANDQFVCTWLADDLSPGGVDDPYAATFSGDVAGAAHRTTPANPDSYTVTGNPILGGTATMEVDLNTTGHSSAILFGFDTPFAGLTLAGGQVLLCLDFGGGEGLTGAGLTPTGVAGGIASFSLPVPNVMAFNGLKLCTQAIHAFGVTPFDLSNAQDWVVGTY